MYSRSPWKCLFIFSESNIKIFHLVKHVILYLEHYNYMENSLYFRSLPLNQNFIVYYDTNKNNVHSLNIYGNGSNCFYFCK